MKSIRITGDRQSGVTHSLLQIAIFHALIERKRVAYISANFKQKRIDFNQAVDMCGVRANVIRSSGNERISLDDGCIRFLAAGSRDSLRGMPLDTIIFDHGARIDRETWVPALVNSPFPSIFFGHNEES